MEPTESKLRHHSADEALGIVHPGALVAPAVRYRTISRTFSLPISWTPGPCGTTRRRAPLCEQSVIHVERCSAYTTMRAECARNGAHWTSRPTHKALEGPLRRVSRVTGSVRSYFSGAGLLSAAIHVDAVRSVPGFP